MKGRENLETYLNDHLAGSIGALELIEHFARSHAGMPLEKFFADLHVEISADQEVLRDLMRALEIKEGAMRKAGAWVAEKISLLKLSTKGEEDGEVGYLQALEGLVLGIVGKQMLWRALASAAEQSPELCGPDYAGLEQRAVEQRALVEEKRLGAARDAFSRPNE